MKTSFFKTVRITKGLTLLEVLVALIILSTAFLGIIMTVVSAKRYTIHSKRRLQAVNAARNVLERIRGTNAAITEGTCTTTGQFESGVPYTLFVNVTNSSLLVDCMKATAVIRWNETEF